MLKKVASTDQFTPEEMAKIRALIGTAKKTTHIIQVLDESGSMNAGIDITLSSYNEMTDVARRAQLASGDETTATLITFADEAEVMYEQVPIGSVVALTKANYVPEGMTALYDAIGLAIHTASKFKTDENTAFLLQIFTDGGENVSKFYGAPRLKSMIEELNATGKWTVTVAGPQGNIDIFAQALSIPTGNVTGFDPGSLQSRSINASNMIASTAHYFSARAAGQSMVNDAYSAVELTPEIQSKITTSSVSSAGIIAEAQPDKDAQLSGDALASAQ